MHSQKFKYLFLLAFLLTFFAGPAFPQNRRKVDSGKFSARYKPVEVALDSIALARVDSLARADSLWKADSTEMMAKSSIDRPAFSDARDSIREDFSNGNKKVFYYGDVKVKYSDFELAAEYMEYDMNTGTVYACGVYDTLSKEWKGRPVMTQGKTKYHMEEVRYNFKTRRARITNMLTQDDEAIMQGRNIKMMEDQSINLTQGKYTVCDYEEPHYYLDMSLAKVVTKPSQKTVFGPAHLVVEGVHLHGIGLPFGFVPERPQRATGLLMPTIGEEKARGFYMRDAGMYFVFGDHMDISLTGDLYTLGSWAVNLNSRYKFNYKCNGSFAINYSNDQTGEQGSPDFTRERNFGLSWNHSQDSKAHPGTSFSASVNFSTPTNNRYNSRSVDEALENRISSSISYSHNWNGKINLSINALHNQNSRDSSYSFTLPNISLSVSTFYPFKRKTRVGSEKFYEKFSFGYSTAIKNNISFLAKEFGKPGFLDKFNNGMNHDFKIGLPSFTLFNYLNFTPSVQYTQNWFFRKSDYAYNPETGKLEQNMGKQFSSFGITQSYNMGISMSTRLYGLFNFGKSHHIQAIRHVITPSLGFSFAPNLRTHANGWRTLDYVDTSGISRSYEYNIYAGQVNSAPASGRSGSLSIKFDNNLEAKVRDPKDTTGTGNKIVKLLENLSVSTNYNFMADSMRLEPIRLSMNAKLFNQVSFNASATLDPYAISRTNAQPVGEWAVKSGQGLVRLTRANVSASYNFSRQGTFNGNTGSQSTSSDYYEKIYYHPITGEYIPGGWLYYTNPNSPWNIDLKADFSYSPSYSIVNEELVRKGIFTATLGVSGDLKLTPRLKLRASSGYDFIGKGIAPTQISATFDLHCFNISVSWVPTGMYKSYSFRIAANAAALADILRFRKSKSYWDN